MKRIAILMVVCFVVLAADLSACEWWTCVNIGDGYKDCMMRFDGGSADMWAGSCQEVCDCPSPGMCSCWCDYEGMCFQV